MSAQFVWQWSHSVFTPIVRQLLWIQIHQSRILCMSMLTKIKGHFLWSSIDRFCHAFQTHQLADICDFEEGSCNWKQQTNDDFDWVRQSGSTLNPNTGPDSDHTTNAPMGHYYYLSSSAADSAGQTAQMSSALYPAGETASSPGCCQYLISDLQAMQAQFNNIIRLHINFMMLARICFLL